MGNINKGRRSAAKRRFREKLHKVIGCILAVIAIVLVIAVFGGAYYLIIAPSMVSKPFIEKPVLSESELSSIEAGENVIGSEHINYIVNEIGAYKLKKLLGTDRYPIIESVITDSGEKFYSYVKDHMPITGEGDAKDEDIIIRGSQKTIFNILSSDNVLSAVKKAKDNGEVEVELVSDMKTLAAKGYLSIYDNLR
ncbi:hypothetical protein KY366_01140 [Candidatus Woesearchaeota archaeon]|nr:hypothetical protein [Candidatus Woesearchaeota archaeon]